MSASANTASAAVDSKPARLVTESNALEAAADAAWRVVDGLDRLRRVCETEWTFRFFDSREAQVTSNAERESTEFFRGSDRGWQVFCKKFECETTRERKSEGEPCRAGGRCRAIVRALESSLQDIHATQRRVSNDMPIPNDSAAPESSDAELGRPPSPAQSGTTYRDNNTSKQKVQRKALVLLIAPKPELPEEVASFTAEALTKVGKSYRALRTRAIWVCCDMDVLKPSKSSQHNQTPTASQCESQQCGKEDSRQLHSESNAGERRRMNPELARALQVVFSGQGRIISSALLRKAEGLGWVLLRGRGDSKSRARLFSAPDKQHLPAPVDKPDGSITPKIRREGTMPESPFYLLTAQTRLEAVGDFDGKPLSVQFGRLSADAGDASRPSVSASILSENGHNVRAQDARTAMLPQHRRAREIQRLKKTAGGRSGSMPNAAAKPPPMVKKLSGRGSQLLALTMHAAAGLTIEPTRNTSPTPQRMHGTTATPGCTPKPTHPRKEENVKEIGRQAEPHADNGNPSDVEVEDIGAGGNDSDGDSVEGNLPGACPVEVELRDVEASLLHMLANPCELAPEEMAEKAHQDVGKALLCLVRKGEDGQNGCTPRDTLRKRLFGGMEKQGIAGDLSSAERIKAEAILRFEISAASKTGADALSKPEDPPAKKLKGELTELLRKLQLFEGGQLHVFFNTFLMPRYGTNLPKTLKYISKKLEIEEDDVPSLGGDEPRTGIPETTSVGVECSKAVPITSAAPFSQGIQREALKRIPEAANRAAPNGTVGIAKGGRGLPIRRGYDSRLVRMGSGIRKPLGGSKTGRGGLRRGSLPGNSSKPNRTKVGSPLKSLSRNLHTHSLQHVTRKAGDGAGPSSAPKAAPHRTPRKGKTQSGKNSRPNPDADKCVLETPLRARRAATADREDTSRSPLLAPLPIMALSAWDGTERNTADGVATTPTRAAVGSEASESDADSDVVPETIQRTPPRPKTIPRSPPVFNLDARFDELLSNGCQTEMQGRRAVPPAPRWGGWMTSATQQTMAGHNVVERAGEHARIEEQLRAFSPLPEERADPGVSSEEDSPLPVVTRRTIQPHVDKLDTGAAPTRHQEGGQADLVPPPLMSVLETIAFAEGERGAVEAEGGAEVRGQADHAPLRDPTANSDAIVSSVEVEEGAMRGKGGDSEQRRRKETVVPSHPGGISCPISPASEAGVVAAEGQEDAGEEREQAQPSACQPSTVPPSIANVAAAQCDEEAGYNRKGCKDGQVEVGYTKTCTHNSLNPGPRTTEPANVVLEGALEPTCVMGKTPSCRVANIQDHDATSSVIEAQQVAVAAQPTHKAAKPKTRAKKSCERAAGNQTAGSVPAKDCTGEEVAVVEAGLEMTSCDVCRMESTSRSRRTRAVVKCRRCVKCRQAHCHEHAMTAWGRKCFSAKALKTSKPCRPCSGSKRHSRKASDGTHGGGTKGEPRSDGSGMPGTGTLLIPDTPRPAQPSGGEAPAASATMRVGFAHVPFHTSAAFAPASLDIIRKGLDRSEVTGVKEVPIPLGASQSLAAPSGDEEGAALEKSGRESHKIMKTVIQLVALPSDASAQPVRGVAKDVHGVVNTAALAQDGGSPAVETRRTGTGGQLDGEKAPKAQVQRRQGKGGGADGVGPTFSWRPLDSVADAECEANVPSNAPPLQKLGQESVDEVGAMSGAKEQCKKGALEAQPASCDRGEVALTTSVSTKPHVVAEERRTTTETAAKSEVDDHVAKGCLDDAMGAGHADASLTSVRVHPRRLTRRSAATLLDDAKGSSPIDKIPTAVTRREEGAAQLKGGKTTTERVDVPQSAREAAATTEKAEIAVEASKSTVVVTPHVPETRCQLAASKDCSQIPETVAPIATEEKGASRAAPQTPANVEAADESTRGGMRPRRKSLRFLTAPPEQRACEELHCGEATKAEGRQNASAEWQLTDGGKNQPASTVQMTPEAAKPTKHPVDETPTTVVRGTSARRARETAEEEHQMDIDPSTAGSLQVKGACEVGQGAEKCVEPIEGKVGKCDAGEVNEDGKERRGTVSRQKRRATVRSSTSQFAMSVEAGVQSEAVAEVVPNVPQLEKRVTRRHQGVESAAKAAQAVDVPSAELTRTDDIGKFELPQWSGRQGRTPRLRSLPDMASVPPKTTAPNRRQSKGATVETAPTDATKLADDKVTHRRAKAAETAVPTETKRLSRQSKRGSGSAPCDGKAHVGGTVATEADVADEAGPTRRGSGSTVVPNSQPSSTEEERRASPAACGDQGTAHVNRLTSKRSVPSGVKPTKRQRLSGTAEGDADREGREGDGVWETGAGSESADPIVPPQQQEQEKQVEDVETKMQPPESTPHAEVVEVPQSDTHVPPQLMTFARAMAPSGRSPEEYAVELRRVLEANDLLPPETESSLAAVPHAKVTPQVGRQAAAPAVSEVERVDAKDGTANTASPLGTPSGKRLAGVEGVVLEEGHGREPLGVDNGENSNWGWLGAVLTPVASVLRMVRRSSVGPAEPSPSPPPPPARWDPASFLMSPATRSLLDSKPPTPFMEKFGDKSPGGLDPVATPSGLGQGLELERSLKSPNSVGACALCNPEDAGARCTPCARCMGPQLPVGSDSVRLDNSDPRGSNARVGRQTRRHHDSGDDVNQSLHFMSSASPEERSTLRKQVPASTRDTSDGRSGRTARAVRGLFKRERVDEGCTNVELRRQTKRGRTGSDDDLGQQRHQPECVHSEAKATPQRRSARSRRT